MKWLWLACLLVLDAVSKMGALAWIPPLNFYDRVFPFGGMAIFEIPGVTFSLNYVVNTGAAYGLFPGYPGVLFGFRLCMIALLAGYLIFFQRAAKNYWPLWIIVTGALGNVLDYVLYGHVIDFFHFTFWGRSFPVFNLADAYITIGVFLLLFLDLKKKQPKPI